MYELYVIQRIPEVDEGVAILLVFFLFSTKISLYLQTKSLTE